MLKFVQSMMRGLCAFFQTGNPLIDCIELITSHRQFFREGSDLCFDALKFRQNFTSCHLLTLSVHRKSRHLS